MINKYQMPKFMVLALHQESDPRNHTTKEKGTMKTLAISATLLLLAACAFAQAPVAPLQTPKTDVYVGFVITYPDYGPTFSTYHFSGVEAAYTMGITRHVSMTATGDFVGGSTYSVKQISGTVGPKYYFLTGNIRPYVTTQFGFALQNSNGMYAGDHHPPAPAGKSLTENGFTFLYGAGLDLQVTRRFYRRAIQFDTQIMPWGRHTPWYTNVGTGVGYRF